jgi:hypothetical protein
MLLAPQKRLSQRSATAGVDIRNQHAPLRFPLKTVETVGSLGIIFREVHFLKPKQTEQFRAACKLKLLALSLLCSLLLRANPKSKYLKRELYLKPPPDVSVCTTIEITPPSSAILQKLIVFHVGMNFFISCGTKTLITMLSQLNLPVHVSRV